MPKLEKNVLRASGAVLILAIAFCLSFATAYLTVSLAKVFVGGEIDKPVVEAITINEPVPTPKTESVISVLLLGYGGTGHDGGTLSDVIMLVRVDYASKRVALVSIPRDLWVELPVRSDLNEQHKINMAHAIGLDDTRYPLKEPKYKGEAGGGEMAKYAVEKVTGIPVDYFISVSFEGFSQIVDSLDGIEVEVPVAFDDHFYPVKGLENETCNFTEAEIELFHRQYTGFDLEKQFTCRYEHLHFDAGLQHMDGETALKFVRSRHSDTHGGDFARSQRQQVVLNAVKDKILSLRVFNNPKEFVDKVSNATKTDADLVLIDEIVKLIGNPGDYEIVNINLTTDNVFINSRSTEGQFILLPREGNNKWSETHNFVARNL